MNLTLIYRKNIDKALLVMSSNVGNLKKTNTLKITICTFLSVMTRFNFIKFCVIAKEQTGLTEMSFYF